MSYRTLELPRLLLVHHVTLLDTLDSDPVPSGTIRNICSPSVTLRVSLIGQQSNREISASALLDSGAKGMIINTTFALKHKLTLRTLKTPLPIKNVDSSPNKSGPIRSTTIQTIHITTPDKHYHQEHSEFYVTNVGSHNIILRTDWLKAHNPELDWTSSHLAFTHCPPSYMLSTKALTILPANSKTPSMYISSLKPSFVPPTPDIFDYHAAPVFLSQHQSAKILPAKPVHVCAKMMHSIAIASNPAKASPLTHIPAQFLKYCHVFSESASHHLPAHQP